MTELTELLPSLGPSSESEDTDVVHVPIGVLRRGIEELIALRRWCEPSHPFAAGVMIGTARLWAGRWKQAAREYRHRNPGACVLCTSQPDDESPCSCMHAPCIHDRNAMVVELQRRLDDALATRDALIRTNQQLGAAIDRHDPNATIRTLRVLVATLTETNENQRRTIEALRADVDGPS